VYRPCTSTLDFSVVLRKFRRGAVSTWWGLVAEQPVENAFDSGLAERVLERAEEPDTSASQLQRASERRLAVTMLVVFVLTELAWLLALLLGLVRLLR
jgi:hypothetical protein